MLGTIEDQKLQPGTWRAAGRTACSHKLRDDDDQALCMFVQYLTAELATNKAAKFVSDTRKNHGLRRRKLAKAPANNIGLARANTSNSVLAIFT